jgi:hypothetical protein
MDDSQFVAQPERASAPPADTDSSNVPKKKRRTTVIVVAVVVVAVCLCSSICVVAGGWGIVTGIIKAAQERDDVTAVIDQFMGEMEKKDAAAAYALFSTRAQRQMVLSNLEKLVEGSNYVIFDGYESVVVTNLSIKAAFNTNANAARGTIAEVAAVVTYEGGITGKLTAILEEEDGEWRLHNFNITVPPSKMDSP